MSETRYQMELLKAMNQNLSTRERMYRLFNEMTDGAFLYFCADKTEVTTIGKWSQYFDFKISEKRDLERIYDAMDEPYVIPLRDLIHLEKAGKDYGSLECQNRKKTHWFRFQVMVVYAENGSVAEKAIGIFNITKYKKQAEELIYHSHYDVLTGLYNRNYFVSFLGNYILKAEKENETVSVMMIDIDDFHKVNDSLGMIYGDELLQQFAVVLKDLCNDRVTACHLNSDVYCIAVYGKDHLQSSEKIYELILKRLEKPFALSNGRSIRITVTIGVACYPEAAKRPLDLINCSEIVMLKAKNNGKNAIQYFDTPILHDFMKNVELETKLKEALAHKRFELYYQPQYYSGNQKLRGVEALIRWRDTDERMISPAVFIPMAEKNGSIVPLGNWVVKEAIGQYARCRDLFGSQFIMSINISARQLNQTGFVRNLLGELEKYRVDPYQIELEVTESILIEDFEVVCEKLRVLRDKGIRISLDDFGTGFSSLSYLKKLPINTLKIDKTFIDTVLVDSTTRIITESIINMVKALGFESIAEGVEEEQQLKYLHAIGCDVIQGYLLGKPLAAQELEKLLESDA